MAKSKKKSKLTTNEALEQLLGHKAAKRLRQLAIRLAADDDKKKKPKKSKKATKAKKPKTKKAPTETTEE